VHLRHFDTILEIIKTMPIYTVLDAETREPMEDFWGSYDALQEFLQENPHLIQGISAPNIIGGVGDGVRPPDHFKEVMSKISDANPNSPLAQDYGKKDNKTIKTQAAVAKAKKKAGGSLVG
jgi:hypothetical protein